MRLPIFLTALIFTGCGTLYLPAGWDSNPPQTTPLRVTERRDYIGGDINVSTGYNPNESNVQGRAFYAAADGGTWWRLSGSGFLYGGTYDVTQAIDSTLHGNRFYIGAGGLSDINISIPIDMFSIGIGAFGGVIAEAGPYSAVWRKENVSYLLPLVGAYWFMNFRFAGGNQVGAQLTYGFPGLVTVNAQADLGQYLISAGTGATFASGQGVREMGRFTAGVAYRLR